MEIVKIRTLKGRIITMTIEKKTSSHYWGVDKFGHDVIIKKDDIDSLISMGNEVVEHDL